MVCGRCGSEIASGARFCPVCGAPVQAAEPVAEVPGVPVPPKAPRRSRSSLVAIAAACISVVAAVVVVAFVATDGFTFGGADTVTLGQEEAVSASLSTRFVPKDRKGEAITSYLVALVRQGKKTKGVDEALYSFDTTPYRLEVKKGEGFSVSDFGDGVPSGRYACHVVEGSGSGSDKDGSQEDGQSFLIDYAPDNKDARDELSVLPQEEDKDAGKGEAPKKRERRKEDPKKTAYKLYQEKIDEYIAKYGEPGSLKDEYGITKVKGLYLVQLRDFNDDGLPELVLGYDNPSIETNNNQGDLATTIDVWMVKSGKLERAYSRANAQIHDQGTSGVIPVATIDGAPVLFSGHPNTDVVGDYAWYALKDGEFAPVLTYTIDAEPSDSGSLYGNLRYTVNGKEASEASYQEAYDRPKISEYFAVLMYSEDPSSSAYSGGDAAFHSVDETVSLTNQTIEKIRSQAATKDEDTEKKSSKKSAVSWETQMANGALGSGQVAYAGGYDYIWDSDQGLLQFKGKSDKAKKIVDSPIDGRTRCAAMCADGDHVYVVLADPEDPVGKPNKLYQVSIDGGDVRELPTPEGSQASGDDAPSITQLYLYDGDLYTMVAYGLKVDAYRISTEDGSATFLAHADSMWTGMDACSLSKDALYSYVDANRLVRVEYGSGTSTEIFNGPGRWHAGPVIYQDRLYVYELSKLGDSVYSGYSGALYSMKTDGSDQRKVYTAPDGVRDELRMIADGKAYFTRSNLQGDNVKSLVMVSLKTGKVENEVKQDQASGMQLCYAGDHLIGVGIVGPPRQLVSVRRLDMDANMESELLSKD